MLSNDNIINNCFKYFQYTYIKVKTKGNAFDSLNIDLARFKFNFENFYSV